MRIILYFLFCLVILSVSAISGQITDNPELIELYKADQADRLIDHIDWDIVSKRDRLREAKVYELLDSKKVKTSKDY